MPCGAVPPAGLGFQRSCAGLLSQTDEPCAGEGGAQAGTVVLRSQIEVPVALAAGWFGEAGSGWPCNVSGWGVVGLNSKASAGGLADVSVGVAVIGAEVAGATEVSVPDVAGLFGNVGRTLEGSVYCAPACKAAQINAAKISGQNFTSLR